MENMKNIMAAAKNGDAHAQFLLGGCCYKGEGVEQDYAQAVSWFRKAAEQGHARAQFNVGACYAQGTGVKQDSLEAVA
jgi:TPR repeat protein